MADEITAPKVETVSFSGNMVGTKEEMKGKLTAIPFLSVKIDGDSLLATKVESRNIRKMPFLFYIMRISGKGLEITYSIAPDTSESMRRLTVLKDAMSLLAVVYDDFRVEENVFFQYVDAAIDSVMGGLTQNYSSLFNSHEALLNEYREMKKLNAELAASNRNLTIQATQLNDENAELKDKVAKLETYSDQSLMAMIQDWIESHNNSIDIEEFSKAYKLSTPRIELMLDKMVSLGYLELRG